MLILVVVLSLMFSFALSADECPQLKSKKGILQKIIFEKGKPLVRLAIFFNYPSTQRSDVAASEGVEAAMAINTSLLKKDLQS